MKDSGISPRHWLLIFDDQISESSLLTDKKSPLFELSALGRHYNISMITLLQAFRSVLNPTIRLQ